LVRLAAEAIVARCQHSVLPAPLTQLPVGLTLFRIALARLAAGATEVVFQYDVVGETRVAYVDLHYQIAVGRYARSERDGVAAVAQLLMRDFDTSAVLDNGPHRQHRDARERTAQKLLGLSRRMIVKGKEGSGHAGLLCRRGFAHAELHGASGRLAKVSG